MAIENRKHERVPSDFFVLATVGEGGEARSATCRNLSVGGAFIEMSGPPATGAVIDLVIEVPSLELAIGVQAEVIWARPPMPDRQFPAGVGVRFVNLSDESRQRIEETLEALKKRPR